MGHRPDPPPGRCQRFSGANHVQTDGPRTSAGADRSAKQRLTPGARSDHLTPTRSLKSKRIGFVSPNSTNHCFTQRLLHGQPPGHQLNHENAPSTVSLWPGPFLSINVACQVRPSSKLQDASKALLVHLPDPQVAKSLLVQSVAAFGRLRLRSFGRAVVPVAGPCGWLGRWSLVRSQVTPLRTFGPHGTSKPLIYRLYKMVETTSQFSGSVSVLFGAEGLPRKERAPWMMMFQTLQNWCHPLAWFAWFQGVSPFST